VKAVMNVVVKLAAVTFIMKGGTDAVIVVEDPMETHGVAQQMAAMAKGFA